MVDIKQELLMHVLIAVLKVNSIELKRTSGQTVQHALLQLQPVGSAGELVLLIRLMHNMHTHIAARPRHDTWNEMMSLQLKMQVDH